MIREKPAGSGRYEVVVYVGANPLDGTKEKRMSRVVRGTLRDARTREAEMLLEVRRGVERSTAVTVDALLTRWVDHIEARGRSPWTLRGYRAYIKRSISPALGAVRLDRLTAQQLDAYYDALLHSGLSSTTVRQCHAILSAALTQAEKWGLVARNVARLASPPPVRQTPKPVPTVEQLRELVKHAQVSDPTMASLIMVAALTGARRGELCGLRWADVDEEAGTVRLHDAIYDGGGAIQVKDLKNHQERTIAIDPSTIEALHAQRERAERRLAASPSGVTMHANPYAFSPAPDSSAPLRPNDVSHRFRALCGELGYVGLMFHSLRHLSVSMGLDAGLPMRVVSERAGHRNENTTRMIYSHAIQGRDRELANALGAALRSE